MNLHRGSYVTSIYTFAITCSIVVIASGPSAATPIPGEPCLPSGGSFRGFVSVLEAPTSSPPDNPETRDDPDPRAPPLLNSFEGINFDEDAVNVNFYLIPPDPCGAAGPNHFVSVVNSSIEWFTKAGTLQNSQRFGHNGSTATGSFFAAVAPVNATFDPKVIYDQYNSRFVVVALEQRDTFWRSDEQFTNPAGRIRR
jgi:hypothetical protein